MIELRPMTQRDLGDVVAIHRAAFPNFFLSFLGPRFLRVFYGFIVSDGIAIVAMADGTLAGFVAGVSQPKSFYRRLMRRRFVRLALAITPAVVRHPTTLGRVVRRARQRTGGDRHGPEGAELMSLAVDPKQQHRGVGRELVTAFANHLAANGERRLWLTTDAADNDRVILFYERQGFSRSREFVTAEGRAMVEMTLNLEQS
jgi:ribosomal protein S18 acetylase RimI-like enzyme